MIPPDAAPATNTIQELRQAKNLLQEVTESLKAQQAILQQRGIGMPPEVLKSLRSVRSDLSKLESTLVEEQTELGQLRALADMAAQITTSLSVDDVLEETMDLVIALTRAERGYVILADAETGEFEFRVRREDTLKPMQGGAGGQPQVSNTVLQEVLNTREPLLADNAYQDERFSAGASIANMSLRSVLCVPLTFKDELLGAVYVDNRLQAGIFTNREKNTLTAFANTAAVALANARMYEEVQRALSELTQVQELMNNVFESIGSGVIATDEADMITTFNRAAQEILEASREEMIGHTLSEVLPRIAADIRDNLAALREEPHEVETVDSLLTTQDGQSRAVSFKLSPLQDSASQTTGVAVVVDDMTQQREHEQQMRVMNTYLPPELLEKIGDIAQLALGGEKREVTCLFAEVYPLKMLQKVTPKEAMDIMNTYLAVATDCIHDTNGIIDKYMGNEVMAIWNTQLSPQENHAQLAVECSLVMRDRFLDLYTQLGIDPDPHLYRIGMHTGFATLGNVGSPNRRDFTAIGDTINLSKRIEENSHQGEIVMTDSTLSHFKKVTPDLLGQYHFADREAIHGKGVSSATLVYGVFRQNGG